MPPRFSAVQVVKANQTGALKTIRVVAGAGELVGNGDRVKVHIKIVRMSKVLVDTFDMGLPFEYTVGTNDAPEFVSMAVTGLKSGGMRECVVPGALVAKWNGAMYGQEDVTLTVSVLGVTRTPSD